MALARFVAEKSIMRVFIVDNFPPMRDRLKNLLSTLNEVEIIGEAQDVPGAFNLYCLQAGEYTNTKNSFL